MDFAMTTTLPLRYYTRNRKGLFVLFVSTDQLQIAFWIKRLCQYSSSKQAGKGKWPKIHCYGVPIFSQFSTIEFFRNSKTNLILRCVTITFVFFSDRNIRQIRKICQILLISLILEKLNCLYNLKGLE